MSGSQTTSQVSSPKDAANQAFSNYTVEPTSLVEYSSGGRLLIIGSEEEITCVWNRIPETVTCSALLIGKKSHRFKEPCIIVENLAEIRIEGFLGAFTVILGGNETGQATPIRKPENYAFDLILDLVDPPLIDASLPPPGYYAPREERKVLTAHLATLSEMVGDFDKPKFFQHLPDVCAHSRSGILGCDLCIKICAPQAITSNQSQIHINPHLCQGCGDCTSACPAGAVNYLYPSRTDTFNRIRLMVNAYFEHGGDKPVLIFHEVDATDNWLQENQTGLPANLLTYELEALGSIGMDIWLATMALGVERIVVLESENIATETQSNLCRQMQFAREILAGISIEPSRLTQSDSEHFDPNEVSQITHSLLSKRQRAHFAGIEDKRRLIQMAVEALQHTATDPPDWIPLSQAAPFGEILVNQDSCTLCMACVQICPEGALVDNQEQPQLKLIETNCVQCGLCREACPEEAITLSPRYLLDQNVARRPKVLHEEKAFACIGCGKPFASESMILAITERLKSHPMYQGNKLNQLKLCEDCRIKTVFDV